MVFFYVFEFLKSWVQKFKIVEKYLIIQRIVLECKHFQIKSLGEYPRQTTEFKKVFR